MVTVILLAMVTSLCWWLYEGDWFEMLVTESLCWRLFRYVDDFLNVLNRSPTSKTCHQHIWSQTSVTNIDLTAKNFEKFRKLFFDVFQRWYSKLGLCYLDFKIFDKVKFFDQVQVSSQKISKMSKILRKNFEKFCLDHYGTSTLSIFGRSDKNWARMEFLEVYHSTIWNCSTGISTLG